MLLRGIFYTFAIIISFLLQTSVFSFLKLADTAPNVMLALVVCIAMMRGRKEGLIVGFFCGLLIDLFYGTTMGQYALLFFGSLYRSPFLMRFYSC
ncbi:MAG TPA: rod shape-determining protein MreD [Candidatus Fimousia stercorigallinarum]|nr:rod shape-determining protein MreD [Candidatus Fimousia stercorigallinarum]